MDSDAYAAIIIAILSKRKKLNKHEYKPRKSVAKWFYQTPMLSCGKLLDELKISSRADFENFHRMEVEVFNELLGKVQHLIQKQDTILRESISARRRLSTCLRFLVSGLSFEDLRHQCGMAPITISGIVMETCRAISSALKDNIKVSNITF